jgi:hypothetical protein
MCWSSSTFPQILTPSKHFFLSPHNSVKSGFWGRIWRRELNPTSKSKLKNRPSAQDYVHIWANSAESGHWVALKNLNSPLFLWQFLEILGVGCEVRVPVSGIGDLCWHLCPLLRQKHTQAHHLQLPFFQFLHFTHLLGLGAMFGRGGGSWPNCIVSLKKHNRDGKTGIKKGGQPVYKTLNAEPPLAGSSLRPMEANHSNQPHVHFPAISPPSPHKISIQTQGQCASDNTWHW